ncbi:NADH-ubiquinone oxidoreductase assembly factor N7BML [Colletotrichum scovillei]|uniref:NADH-ubiquinone oxidoreductase assembly factor N7BML n=1 Tax=Colletotrichum scovillei TaxID=1209932 RepID=A0A9P7UGJ6_9PEZI|nr:NADH-ubiquinone oxidoreductase assembly factor N7BML [Colletotrichum scovillei]KAG7070832.1 NADH-ubiquinone oxidoreductase assembly factor N7BML [Colletotrichum scovillei]KAG7079101.1 NADH-ubiquinone oxidoreductase assembly factor N7BML [Colletotrichum scovillei]
MAQTLPCRHVPFPVPGPSIPIVNVRGELTRSILGRDLQGYTFWEFRESRGNGPGRFRRIVNYPRSTYLSDVKVSPLWHQWLRYTREDPPTLEEQTREAFRQERMKVLSAQADARWEAKPRLTDAPGQQTGQPLPSLNTARSQPTAPELEAANTNAKTTEPPEDQAQPATDAKKKYGKDPWAKASGPSEGWQPEAWVPPSGKK